MRGAPEKTLEAVFDMLARAAGAGERCPTNRAIDLFMMEKRLERRGDSATDVLKALARSGRIILTVHAHNWRVAEILTGSLALKSTMSAPREWAAYLRVGRTTERLTR